MFSQHNAEGVFRCAVCEVWPPLAYRARVYANKSRVGELVSVQEGTPSRRPFTIADVGKRVVITERDGQQFTGKILEYIPISPFATEYAQNMLQIKMDYDPIHPGKCYPEDMCKLED